MNLLLAVFNLLPAFPLDGGRILRALLWRRSGDHLGATRAAATVGHGFGILMIVLGVLELITMGNLSGIWLVFLGWFLNSSAQAEARSVLLHDALSGVLVREVMSPDPMRVPDWITLDELLHAYVLPNRFSAFPVRDFNGNVVGMVTLADLKAVPAELRPARRVRDITRPLNAVPIARPDEPLLDLFARFRPATGERALVFDNSQLVGIVSPTDVTRAVQKAALLHRPKDRVPGAMA
jgi:CBS domain-containing protein